MKWRKWNKTVIKTHERVAQRFNSMVDIKYIVRAEVGEEHIYIKTELYY